MKSEPDEFSFEQLRTRRTEPWTGVRNYQARNFMRAAAVGDLVLFYHSNCPEPGIAGVAKISKAAFTDPTQFDAKSDYYDPKSPAKTRAGVALKWPITRPSSARLPYPTSGPAKPSVKCSSCVLATDFPSPQ